MDQAAADWWFSLLNPPCVCSAPLDVVVLVFFLQSAAFVTGRLCRRAPALAAAGKTCGGKGEKEKSVGRGGPDCWQMGCWDLELGCLESRCPRGAAGPSPSRGLYQSILPLGACTGRACSSALTSHCSSAEGTCGTRCWEKGQDSISQPLVVRGKEQLCPGVAAGGWKQNCS